MSKRVFEHPQEEANGPQYWRSFGQLAQTPEFKEWQTREFQPGTSELNSEVGRRGFMKYMAASAALAGLSLSACRREEKTLVPFAQSAEWSVPGKPIFYATSRPHRRGAIPLVATTHDGRPTKVDGNPGHATNHGATDTQSQASLLDLYDPDRSKRFQHKGVESSEAEFTKWLAAVLEKAGDGEGVAFLTEHFTSPTFGRMQKAVAAKLPKALWVSYEPLNGSEASAANEAAFGEGFRAGPQIDKADVILSLDCDFLGFDEGRLEGIRAFAARRKPEQKMNRLYVVENRYTTTGGMADHRLRSQAAKVGAVARAFAEAIAAATGDAALKSVVDAFPKVATTADAVWIAEAAKDLVAQKGKALVLVGYRQPAAVQALGHAINAALGAFGTTIVGRKTHRHGGGVTIQELAIKLGLETAEQKKARVEKLTEENAVRKVKHEAELPIAAKGPSAIKTLFILGGNPVYNAPADLKFGELLASVDVVRHGMYEDETTYSIEVEKNKVMKRNFVTWHVPAAHYLEVWGDGTASDGSYVSQQPMILPLFGGWSEVQLLNFIATGKKADGLELVQETFKEKTGAITAQAWAKFLLEGFLKGSEARAETLIFNTAAAQKLAGEFKAVEAEIEVVFVPCAKVDDGRFSNNAWMQELPDPITKITWDNAAIISPATAEKLGLGAKQGEGRFNFDNGAILSIEANGATLEIPAIIIPGTADGSITIAVGYGRSSEGRVGGREGNYMSHGGFSWDSDAALGDKIGFGNKGQVGFNAYKLRTSANHYFATASVKRLGTATYPLAVTQEHVALEGRGPDVIRESTDAKFNARDKHWLHEHKAMDAHAEEFDALGYPVSRSAYKHPELNDKNHQWAMAVDLSVCTGCSACMAACQSENNIPVVGKEQVIEGRELHWIRMDRYFATPMNSRDDKTINLGEARMVMQPMPCQHCENAPCETVCPVNATVHSDDGINVMAYNRCIGTRYCANNCPFKVRRFNFFDFNERQKDKYFVQNLVNEKGMAETLKLSKNPNVTVRMRGVMEKCTFCVQRVQEAKIAAKVKAKDSDHVQVPTDAFKVACQQVCPTNAITFGNKADAKSAVNRDIENPRAYRVFDYLGIKPRVHYLARIMNPNKAMPKWSQPLEEGVPA